MTLCGDPGGGAGHRRCWCSSPPADRASSGCHRYSGEPAARRGDGAAARAVRRLSLAVLYRFGPSRQPPPHQPILPGIVLATVLWLAASMLLSWYVVAYRQLRRDLRTARRRGRRHAVVLRVGLRRAAGRRTERAAAESKLDLHRSGGPLRLLIAAAHWLGEGERWTRIARAMGRRLRHRRDLHDQFLPRDHAGLAGH